MLIYLPLKNTELNEYISVPKGKKKYFSITHQIKKKVDGRLLYFHTYIFFHILSSIFSLVRHLIFFQNFSDYGYVWDIHLEDKPKCMKVSSFQFFSLKSLYPFPFLTPPPPKKKKKKKKKSRPPFLQKSKKKKNKNHCL